MSGKFSLNTIATGSINLSNNGGAGGLAGVLGCFGYVYDNKNVKTYLIDSKINAGKGIDIKSQSGGTSNLSLVDATVGVVDYAGAFGYVKMNGNTSVDITSSTLANKTDGINIISSDDAAGTAESRGYTFGAISLGTIIAKAKNSSTSDVNITSSKIANYDTNVASNSINISAEKNNSLSSIGFSGTGSGIAIPIVSTLAQDEGKSTVKIGINNYFDAKKLYVLSINSPSLVSEFYSKTVSLLGIGVGDVTTREYGSAYLNVSDKSKFDVENITFGGAVKSKSKQVSEADTIGFAFDILTNKADNISSSIVDVNVDIGKDNYSPVSKLLVSGSNLASATMEVFGLSVGGVLTVCNCDASATANLTTNVNINGKGKSKLSEINAVSTSEAEHHLFADGAGGGLINTSPYAANTYSTMNLNTNTIFNGDFYADKVNGLSNGITKSFLSSEGEQAGLFDICAIEAKVKQSVDTNTLIADNTKINAQKIDLKAENDLNTDGEKKYDEIKLNSYAKTYGGLTGAAALSKQDINSATKVNIGKKAEIIGSNGINIFANTITNLNNNIHSGGAGVGNHTGNESKNTLNMNNYIFTEEGSLLETDKNGADINIPSARTCRSS